jgi:hypothetical protein
MDQIDFIMLVEDEGFDHEDPEQVTALQEIINSGFIWKLQGSWQRFAKDMINAGIVKAPLHA